MEPAECGERQKTKAATARGSHLFPSRTEKLNPGAPMVLRKRESRSPPPSGSPGPDKGPGDPFFMPTRLAEARRTRQ